MEASAFQLTVISLIIKNTMLYFCAVCLCMCGPHDALVKIMFAESESIQVIIYMMQP